VHRFDGQDFPRRHFAAIQGPVRDNVAESSFKKLSTYLVGVANQWPKALMSSLVLAGAWAVLVATDIAAWSPGALFLIPMAGVAASLLFAWRKQKTKSVAEQEVARLRGRVHGSLVLEDFELVRESGGGTCSHLTAYLKFGNRGSIPIEYSMKVLSMRIEGEDNSAIPAPVSDARFHVWPGQQDTFSMSVVLGVGVTGAVSGLIHFAAEYWAPTLPERFLQRQTYRFVNVPVEEGVNTRTDYWPLEALHSPIR
jgi:hypothetical protein